MSAASRASKDGEKVVKNAFSPMPKIGERRTFVLVLSTLAATYALGWDLKAKDQNGKSLKWVFKT